jgi:hypothetical protein
MGKKVDLEKLPGLGWEYNSLRSEILKRIELRQQIISITLTLAGVFLSFGLANELVPLIYPPLAMFLAFGWSQNDFRIRRLSSHIRSELETRGIGLIYETKTQKVRQDEKGMGAWRFVVISHSGIFLFTQVMAVGIELLRSGITGVGLQTGLLIVDGISILMVAWITIQAITRKEKSADQLVRTPEKA